MEVTIPGFTLTYQAVQFHFHHPSEHTIQGKNCPLELHIVHTLLSGAPKEYINTKAVLGIVFDTTKDVSSPLLASLHPETPGAACDVDIQKFIEGVPKKIYHYSGSLTTPPCTEAVNWLVFTLAM